MTKITRIALACVAGMLVFLIVAVIPCVPTPEERGASKMNWPLFSVYLYARDNPSTHHVARAMRILLVHVGTAATVAFGVWGLMYRKARAKRPVQS